MIESITESLALDLKTAVAFFQLNNNSVIPAPVPVKDPKISSRLSSEEVSQLLYFRRLESS
jgi:hypothetical protein